MGGNTHKNKARNQLRCDGKINAIWFQNRRARNRRRDKMAKQSRKKNYRIKKGKRRG